MHCITAVCDAMAQSKSVTKGMGDLWKRYLDDFMYHKFLLNCFAGPITQDFSIHILEDYFKPLEKETDMLTRLLSLHAHVHVHQLSLARGTALLRVLNRLDSALPATVQQQNSFSSSLPDEHPRSITQNRQDDFAIYIINRFFATLQAVFKSKSLFSKALSSWYTVCQDMVRTLLY